MKRYERKKDGIYETDEETGESKKIYIVLNTLTDQAIEIHKLKEENKKLKHQLREIEKRLSRVKKNYVTG